MSQQNNTGLKITLTTVTLDDGSERKRPALVYAELGNFKSSSDPIPHPIAFIDASGDGDPMNGYDKGHLIARHFIGKSADISDNIVPLDPTFNRSGLWKTLELTLAEYVKQGRRVTMFINVQYLNATSLVPSSFIVSAWDNNAGRSCMFGDKALDNMTFTPPEISPVQFNKAELCNQYNTELYDYIIELEAYFKTKIPKDYDIRKQSFMDGAIIGPLGVPRPYQCLDWAYGLIGSNPVKSYCKKILIVNGGIFTAKQRALMQLVNRMRNNGWLVSDDPKDPITDHLTVGAAANAGHIDHIHPKAKAGANAFSNARLISRRHNEATKDTQKKVNEEKTADMEITK